MTFAKLAVELNFEPGYSSFSQSGLRGQSGIENATMSAKLISGIRVQGLFGLYDYCLPESGEFSNATIFYGDNGVGKSTLLRLVFHLLSPAVNKGHRNALYAADFESFEVDLESGIRLTARYHKGLPIRVLSLAIFDKNKQLVAWDYVRRSQQNLLSDAEEAVVEIGHDGHASLRKHRRLDHRQTKEKIPRGSKAYLDILTSVVPTLFILNAERRLDSDSVADPSDEIELRRVMRFEQGKRISELAVRSREIALSQALSAATKWINRNAVLGANQGSMNVHSVYVTVLQHILSINSETSDALPANTASELLEQLSKIEKKTAEHARYELATELSTSELRRALCAGGEEKRKLAATLLRPYIESLSERLKAVEPIYNIIDQFVTIVNGLLMDKQISFRLSQGFNIYNQLGSQLTPAQLSSGEQQLLLLFCYVMTARDQSSVFMIDEPEISLNVKWQRQLVKSLLEITGNATIQFIFASHSMELLAQHKHRVVKLVNKKCPG